MGTLSQAKTLGSVGSILLLLGIVPLAGPVLEIVGFVLMLVAVKYISEVLNNKALFNNAIISVVAAIAGTVVGAVVGVVGVLSLFGPGMFPGVRPSDLMSMNFLGPILAGLAIIWVAFIISAVFLRKSFNAIASGLNVKMFSTAALLYFIGAILTVVIVGFLLIFVAAMLQVVAFFSIPENPPQPARTPSTAM